MVWYLLSSTRIPHPLPLVDFIAIHLQIVIDAAGIIGNIALLTAIICKSPDVWRSFKVLLLTGSITDLIAMIACQLCIERMIPAPIGTAVVFLGSCTLVSPYFCHVAHSVALNAHTHSTYVVAASFFYRLYILKHDVCPSRRAMVVICLAMAILPICMMACTLFAVDDESEIRKAFKNIYDLDEYVVQGHLYRNVAAMLCMAYSAGSAFPVTLAVFFIRRKVISTLEAQKSCMSERTLNVHRTLVKVLTLQACLPALFSVTVICYGLERSGMVYSPAVELTIGVPLKLMALITPFISLFYIKVFRDFVFCRKDRADFKRPLFSAQFTKFPSKMSSLA